MRTVTVPSSAGPEKTIIDGRERGTVVTFDSGEEDDSVLEGFTITNGLAVSSEDTIEHGGGIQLISSGPTIRDCILLANHATGDGGGIYCFAARSRPVIENVVFQGNTADGQGGALCVVSGRPHLSNCLFSKNEAANGGAISASYQARMVLDNCTVADNSAHQAGALYLKNATVETTNSIYRNNSSDDDYTVVMDFDDRRELYSDTVLVLPYPDHEVEPEDIGKTEECQNNADRCYISYVDE